MGWQDHRLGRNQASIDVSPGLAIPSAPDAAVNLAPPFTFSNERDLFGTVRGEYDITDQVTAWAAVGGRSSSVFRTVHAGSRASEHPSAQQTPPPRQMKVLGG